MLGNSCFIPFTGETMSIYTRADWPSIFSWMVVPHSYASVILQPWRSPSPSADLAWWLWAARLLILDGSRSWSHVKPYTFLNGWWHCHVQQHPTVANNRALFVHQFVGSQGILGSLEIDTLPTGRHGCHNLKEVSIGRASPGQTKHWKNILSTNRMQNKWLFWCEEKHPLNVQTYWCRQPLGAAIQSVHPAIRLAIIKKQR